MQYRQAVFAFILKLETLPYIPMPEGRGFTADLVKDLTRDQLAELKQSYLCEQLEQNENRCPSYGELADVDKDIPDEVIFVAYAGFRFCMDDFFCTAGREE